MPPWLIGYFPKRRTAAPEWLSGAGVTGIASVSTCIAPGPEAWWSHWRHNDWGLYDGIEDARRVVSEAEREAFDIYAYELYPVRFDDGRREDLDPPPSTAHALAGSFESLGVDVVSRMRDGGPFECSPLSCNGLARETAVNRNCLAHDVASALVLAASLDARSAEPGPYYIIGVSRLVQRDPASEPRAGLFEAERAGFDALRGLRASGSREPLAWALRELGELQRGIPDHARARASYEEAVALLRGMEVPLKLAHTIRHLGDVHADAGEPGAAEPCYEEALALYRRLGESHPLDRANAIRSYAMLLTGKGEDAPAARLWEEAHGLYRGLDIAPGVAEAAAHLALLADRKGDAPGSRDWLERARAAAKGSGDPATRTFVGEVAARLRG